ncbi:hypothetical protein MNBD_ALPHA06-1581 [hydrothermal vent metagenome]|uniref:Integral membrane protein n=1 Tax=hydrothermal vent metagenome TaxID=652676 RepID=A0A3B0T7C4_9ZZZZ
MSWFVVAKLVHILSAAVLFGTGAGIAFFMFMAWRAKQPSLFAITARHVVLADFLFTTTAVIVQPISGAALIILGGHDPFSGWLLGAYGLYLMVGAFWLPVVWIQIKIRRLTQLAAAGDELAKQQIDPLMRIWFLLGWPAFISVIGIYLLMIIKP